MIAKTNAAVVGVFPDRARAQEAILDLKGRGFRDEQLGVASPDEVGPTATRALAGAAAGASAGVTTGALWALGIAAGVLPGIGPVVAGGLLGSLLASAAGGAAVGGAAGALAGLGIPAEEARYYEGELKAGRTLVTVRAEGRGDEAWLALRRHGAFNLHTRQEGESVVVL
jgi:hypothetical protein